MRSMGFDGLWVVHTALVIVLIWGFVFSSGCLDIFFGSQKIQGDVSPVTTTTSVKHLPPGVMVFCTPPACSPIYCPLEEHGCPGGCGYVCGERKTTPSPNGTIPISVPTYQNMKIGDTAIIPFYGYNLALSVNSFKEYKPDKKLSYHKGCDQAIWYRLQLKLKNIGDEEIRGFYLLVHNEPTLVDSEGNEISPYNCYPETMESGSSTDHSPPQYLLPGDTRYWNFTYVFSDNPQFKFPADTNMSKGAVFYFKNKRCLDRGYNVNNCPNNETIGDDVSWVVSP